MRVSQRRMNNRSVTSMFKQPTKPPALSDLADGVRARRPREEEDEAVVTTRPALPQRTGLGAVFLRWSYREQGSFFSLPAS